MNVGTPSIAGTAKRTFALTAAAGTWSPAGATFAYQWQRDTGSGFADISGATGQSYTMVSADVGNVLRVELHDSGDGAPHISDQPGRGRDQEESGRGLLLVDALADKWDVGPRNPGKIVWCEFIALGSNHMVGREALWEEMVGSRGAGGPLSD